MPRYVILEHDHPYLHWDFMLEAGESLRAWRLAAPPQPGQTVPAEELAAHRRLYLDYEGPVSGGRGNVRRWDTGTFTGEVAGPAVTVALAGRRLQCEARLEGDATGARWHFGETPGEP
jgi:hypothetical protein